MNGAQRIITIGDHRFEGVWFLKAEPRGTRYGWYDTGRPDLIHFGTDDVARVPYIRDRLLIGIADAKEKILFASYLFADDLIVEALCAAARKLRGGVYVLTALGNHIKKQRDIEEIDEKEAERSERHHEHLRRLAEAGVWLRSTEDCHAKFMVVDDALAVVTSANATQDAYERNPEDGVASTDTTVARELGGFFAHVWLNLASLESLPGPHLDVRSVQARKAPPWRGLKIAGSIHVVATMRRAETSLLGAAIEVIDGAKQRLIVATYSFSGIETHSLGAALQRALERKVSIDLLVRPRNHLLAQRKTCSWLKRQAPERVRIFGHRLTHTKSIVADDRDALLWTGNLEAAHGWDSGIEVGVRMKDAGCASAISGWVQDVMARSSYIGVDAPSINELVREGAARSFGGDWDVEISAGLSTGRFAELIQRGPVELVKHRGGLALRCCANEALELRLDEARRRIEVYRYGRADRLGRADNVGWVADCTLRVINRQGTK